MNDLGVIFSTKDTELYLAAFFFGTSLLSALIFVFLQRRAARKRLDNRIREHELNRKKKDNEHLMENRRSQDSIGERTLRLFRNVHSKFTKDDDGLSLKLWQAGFYGANASTWWFIAQVAAYIGSSILWNLAYFLIFYQDLDGGLIFLTSFVFGGPLGIIVLLLFRKNRSDRRTISLRKGWPDFLDLLALTISAGLSLQTALHRIKQLLQRKHPDLALELAVLAAELTYFGEQSRPLKGLSRRCGIAETEDLVAALIQAEKKGLPLNTLLISMARNQRRKRRMEIEKKAASLPAKLTVPMVLFFLPALLIVILAPVAFQLGEIF